jgi:hypothetical protein
VSPGGRRATCAIVLAPTPKDTVWPRARPRSRGGVGQPSHPSGRAGQADAMRRTTPVSLIEIGAQAGPTSPAARAGPIGPASPRVPGPASRPGSPVAAQRRGASRTAHGLRQAPRAPPGSPRAPPQTPIHAKPRAGSERRSCSSDRRAPSLWRRCRPDRLLPGLIPGSRAIGGGCRDDSRTSGQ